MQVPLGKRSIPTPRHKQPVATISSLEEIRRRQESQKPGIAYQTIREELADAARQLLQHPTNHPWAVLGPAIEQAVKSSRGAVGREVTTKVLKSMGLEKYDM